MLTKKRDHYRNGETIHLPGGCDSCQPCRIQGKLCHEHGCPDAWKDYERECFQCGCEFLPKERHQSLCDGCEEPELYDGVQQDFDFSDEEDEE